MEALLVHVCVCACVFVCVCACVHENSCFCVFLCLNMEKKGAFGLWLLAHSECMLMSCSCVLADT